MGFIQEANGTVNQMSSHFVLHALASSSSLREIANLAMWMRTHILILSAVATLLPGCAVLRMTPVPSAGAPTQPTQADSPSSEASPAIDNATTPETLALQIDPPEPNLAVPPAFEPNAKIEHAPALKPGQQEAKPIPQPVQNTPSVAKPVPGPIADDRLLELLRKDIDKALEQPIERRRLQFSRAVIENSRVRHFVNQFSKSNKESFAKLLTRSGRYTPMIAKILREEGLPEEFAYLALIESSFSSDALSPNGAVGLWQFVSGTARTYGLRIDSWVDERRDPEKSTRAAAAYLKDLHDYFGKWYLATAAYNAGQGTIDKALQTPGAKNVWGLSEKAKITEETRNFVPKFVAVSLIATNPGKYGFTDVQYEEALGYEEIEIRGSLRLEAIASMAETDLETIQELNPALLRTLTPPEEAFTVKLPAGKSSVFAVAYEHHLKEKESEPVQVVTHEVRRGETLVSIARRYGQQVRALMELNGLSSPRLRIGQRLHVIIQGLRGGLR
jgi:soluble lytic murein transglycosylase-like protein/LysM repeat protein